MKKKDESKEIISESATKLSQIFVAAAAAFAAGADPYIAGGATLISQFIGLRGRLKINRVESFVFELGKYMESIDVEFDSENVDSEDFGDFFEELLVKVSKTSSEVKLKSFRKMVVSQILEPTTMDLSLRYLNLVNNLEEVQLQLLIHWSKNETTERELAEEMNQASNSRHNFNQETSSKYLKFLKFEDIDELELSLKETKFREIEKEAILEIKKRQFNAHHNLLEIRNSRSVFTSKVEESDLMFLINDLVSKGLLVSTSMTSHIDHIFSNNNLSEFAKNFLKYISEE